MQNRSQTLNTKGPFLEQADSPFISRSISSGTSIPVAAYDTNGGRSGAQRPILFLTTMSRRTPRTSSARVQHSASVAGPDERTGS